MLTMSHTLCYNIPSNEIDTKSMNLLESFVDEWLDTLCEEPYTFCITERFCSDKVHLKILFNSGEDAFFFRINDFPEQFPEFKAISDA